MDVQVMIAKSAAVEMSGRPLPWRVVGLFYVVLTLLLAPWLLLADDKSAPLFVWFLGAIVLPTPAKFWLRRRGYDVDPYRWTWRA